MKIKSNKYSTESNYLPRESTFIYKKKNKNKKKLKKNEKETWDIFLYYLPVIWTYERSSTTNSF